MISFNGILKRISYDEKGETEITFSLNNYIDKETIKQIEKEVPYRFELNKITSKKTEEQNGYLWALIREIAIARGGDRAVSDDWDIYLEAIQRAGAKVIYFQTPLESVDYFQKSKEYRGIKILNTFTNDKGIEIATIKLYIGESKMNTKEMGILLDTILDMAVESGVNINEINYKQS